MERLLNEFTVHRPISEAWGVLTDLERIAPCLPGAKLDEVEGEVYRGAVSVKLGAISTKFKGQAKFVEKDDANHRAVVHGEGRDTAGKGNADALITARLEPLDEASTKCVVETELHITGKVAQFGRGIMADVSKKLIAQFAHNLNTMIDETGTAPATSNGEAAAVAAASGAREAEPIEQTATETSAPPTIRKIEGPAAEPVELTQLAGGAVLKRLLPLIGGLLLVLFVVRRFKKS